jgi:hypothetical protein
MTLNRWRGRASGFIVPGLLAAVAAELVMGRSSMTASGGRGAALTTTDFGSLYVRSHRRSGSSFQRGLA